MILYGYRNFNSYEDEDYEDYDELEDLPEFIDEFPSPEENSVPEPVPQAVVPEVVPELVPQAVVPEADPQAVLAEPLSDMAAQPMQSETPEKPKKKWFGLFGKSDSVPDPQPVAAEPVNASQI